VANIEVGIAPLGTREAEIAEVAVVLGGAEVGVGGNIDRVRPRVRGLELQAMLEALLVMGLQGIVGRLTSTAEPVDAGVENGIAIGCIRIRREIQVTGTRGVGESHMHRPTRNSGRSWVRIRRCLIAVEERIELGAFGTSVSHFERTAARQFALNPKMPLLHVRSQKVLVDREEGRCVGISERGSGEADEQASAAWGLAGLVGDIGDGTVVVVDAGGVVEGRVSRRNAAWPREGLRDEKGRVEAGTGIRIRAVLLSAIEKAVASA